MKDKWKLLHPKYLLHEIHLYGYDFDVKSYLFGCLAILMATELLGEALFLKRLYISVIMLACIMSTPFFVVNVYQIMYQQKRFLTVKNYLENLLYAFQKRNGKILTALQDVYVISEEGEMKEAIGEAIAFIQAGIYENNLYKEAFQIIESHYPTDRLMQIHDFMISIENSGGDFEETVSFFLGDIQEWEFQIGLLQQLKKNKLSEMYGAAAIGVIFCVAVLYLQHKYLPSVLSIVDMKVTQFSSTIFIIMELFVVLYGQRKLKTDWLKEEEADSKEKILEDYRYFMEYDLKKERKESLFWSLPILLISIISFLVWKKRILSFLLIFIGTLLLQQHKLNYWIGYDRIQKRIKMAFPKWIHDLTILLQTYTVPVAILHSLETAPFVLIPEIEALLQRIKEEPSEMRTYLQFLEKFDLPEVRSTMQVLFAMTETGNGDVTLQLGNLTKTNQKLKNESEKLKHQEILAGMGMLVGMPSVVAGVKLFFDLAIFMFFALPSLSQVYGL